MAPFPKPETEERPVDEAGLFFYGDDMRRLRIPVLEPDGHGGARVRTERKPSGKRVHRRGEDEARLASEPWRRTGYGHGYRESRRLCIERAHGRCERCGAVVAVKTKGGWACTTGQTHHMDPLREGGGHDPKRMMLLCPSCHQIVENEARRHRKL